MKSNKTEIVTPNKSTSILPSKQKKRKGKALLFIGIFLIILIGVGYIFRKPLFNVLKGVPFVGQLVPTFSEEQELSREELLIKLKEQETEIATLQSEIDKLEETNSDLKTKNETLKVYETQYANFMDQKEAWDEEVAKSNTDLFIQQFESIYPETAAKLYEQFKKEKLLTDEQEALSKAIAKMEEDQAAKALEVLLTTDSELVDMIFTGMKEDQKAAILSSMSSSAAAQVIKLLSPNVDVIQ